MHISLFKGLTKSKVRNIVLFYVCNIQNNYNPNRNHPYHRFSSLFIFCNHALGHFSRSHLHTYYFIYKFESTFELNKAVLASTDGKQNY